MRKPVYINAISSFHPDGEINEEGILRTPDYNYNEIIPNPNLRRRMSRIVKMGVACGLDCLSKCDNKEINAIITATGLGYLTDMEKFLNNIVENNEQLLNPTAFIQSTFNVVGSQIALLTNNHTYNNTYVHRGLSFESALIDSMMRIWEGDKQVLVGAMDEITPTSHIIMKRLGLTENIALGEGAHFFILAEEKDENSYAELKSVKTFTGKLSSEEVARKAQSFLSENNLDKANINHLITGRNGNRNQDIIYNDIENFFPSATISSFKDICGEYQTASAFALWQGAAIIKEKGNNSLLIYNHYNNINHSLILLNKC
ncbi:MAG: beta-ketoacyl synthase chain length factor [Dysgonomonas sp.]|nr:beta-ketoacyl synthase chain length factor [Dysgonomonas sp.]